MHISIMQFLAGLCPRQSVLQKTRSQLRDGAVPGDWGPSTNKQFCGAKSQSVYHSALLASFVCPIATSQKDSVFQKSAFLFGFIRDDTLNTNT